MVGRKVGRDKPASVRQEYKFLFSAPAPCLPPNHALLAKGAALGLFLHLCQLGKEATVGRFLLPAPAPQLVGSILGGCGRLLVQKEATHPPTTATLHSQAQHPSVLLPGAHLLEWVRCSCGALPMPGLGEDSGGRDWVLPTSCPTCWPRGQGQQ